MFASREDFVSTDPVQAIPEINIYFRKYPWFRAISATAAADRVVLTGYVLSRDHQTQAHNFALALWPNVLSNINVAFHLLLFYLLITDAVFLTATGLIIQLLPHNDPVLVFFHHFGTLILLGFLVAHLGFVLYKNVRH
jgi:hypothetical protein